MQKILIQTFFVAVFAVLTGHNQVNAQEFFPYQDYKGIIHVHSNLSFDSRGEMENMEKAAALTEMDFIITTDHVDRKKGSRWLTYSGKITEKSIRGMIGQTLFIAGGELWKRDGVTILAFPLPDNFIPSEDWKTSARNLKNQGAAVFAGHIEFTSDEQLIMIDDETGLPFLDGIELVNLHSKILQKNIFGLAYTCFRILLPFNWDLAFLINNIPHLNRWYALQNKTYRIIPVFAGNDSHDNSRWATLSLAKVASYHNTFPLLVTHVWADELSESAIVRALKTGRGYFAVEKRGNPIGFRFYITDGSRIFLPGDTVKLKPNLTLKFFFPVSAPKKNTKAVIKKDGLAWLEKQNISALSIPLTSPGIYQTELTEDGKPWIFSNAILVK